MTQQVLFPGWNNFSLEQKSSAKKWIKSVLKLRVASKDLLESFSNSTPTTENALSNPLDELLSNFQFEVVDSLTNSEGIQLQEIIPSVLLSALEDPGQDLCKAVCLLSQNTEPSCVSNCLENLRSFF
ncbi:hypothetical protein QUB68_24495 [Microcoleus sp. A006_D1]|uniref:hypothetical protein n=1 Tax=Microcoleus sp. A006_D1 TaxID=3055267 RepID=UPI002FCFCC8F